MSLFVWLWAAKDWLSALPHCPFCMICVTFAVLTVPTVSSVAQYWCMQTLPCKAATEVFLCEDVWKELKKNPPVFLILASLSLLLSSHGIRVFIRGCSQFAIWCHLNTKVSQSSWSLEQWEADTIQRSSPREPERTALMMHSTISKTHALQLDLDVLSYPLFLLTLLALSGRALQLKTTSRLLVSLFKGELPHLCS